METITLKVQSKHFKFFLELIQKFNFVEVVKKEENIEEYVPRTTEQLEADFRSAMQSVKLHREGKIKLKSLKEVLDEIPD